MILQIPLLCNERILTSGTRRWLQVVRLRSRNLFSNAYTYPILIEDTSNITEVDYDTKIKILSCHSIILVLSNNAM